MRLYIVSCVDGYDTFVYGVVLPDDSTEQNVYDFLESSAPETEAYTGRIVQSYPVSNTILARVDLLHSHCE